MIRKACGSFVLIVAIAGAFVAGSWQRQRDTVSASGLHGRRILYYVDPMHPAYTSAKPGVAPDCNMPLEPVYADGESAADVAPGSRGAAIVLDGRQQQAIGVRVEPVAHRDGVDRVRLFGRVTVAETRIFKLNAGLDGYVRDLSAATTGSHVRKDEWLLTYASPEIRQPVQGYVATLDAAERESRAGSGGATQAAFATAAAAQGVDRLITLGMSPLQVEEIRKSRVVPAHIEVTAPADGFIIARNVSAGEKISKGTEIFRIADLRSVWVLADVAAFDSGRVQPGMTAEIMVAGRATPLTGRVSRGVLPQFDAATQSSKLRIDVDNADFVLRPDMFVDVHLLVPFAAALTIPREAILSSGLRSSVFVERGSGAFEARDVRVGRRLGDRIEILEGLASGERIVVSGTFLLDSESRMRGHD